MTIETQSTLQSSLRESSPPLELIPGPVIMTSIVSNIYIKQQLFTHANSTSTTHVYAYDHLLLLTQGTLQVEVNSQITEFTAPKMIYIQAGQPHQLTAKTDNTLTYSIHALRNNDRSGDIIDPTQVPNSVDLLVSNILASTST
jgi:mannose-6-phosphate isomerase-like protein (cupin superfamily)